MPSAPRILTGLAILAAGAICPATARVLFDFENLADLTPWKLNHARIERVAGQSPAGGAALRLQLHPGAYPGLTLDDPRFLAGWERFDVLRLHIHNPAATIVPLTLRLDDAQSVNFATRYNREFLLRPGANAIELPLRRLLTSDRARNLDPATLRRLLIFASNVRQPLELILADVRLATIPAAPVAGVVRAFDFGPAGSPVMAGFAPVTPADLTGAAPLVAFDNELPDAATRDFISGPADAAFTNRFVVPLTNGAYRVIVCGQSLCNEWAHFPARSYRLSANGRTVAEVEIAAANFYTTDHLFRGIHNNWWPGKDVWAEEIVPKFREHAFDVSVTAGELELTFDTLAVYWLAIAPLTETNALAAWRAELDERRRAEFAERVFYLQPYQPRPPSIPEVLLAAPGQTVSAFFSWPAGAPGEPELRAAPGLTATVRAVRLMEQPVGPGVYRIAPTTLVDPASIPRPTEFCLTVRVDATAAPGVYAGRLGSTRFKVEVVPVKLPASDELPITLGWYYAANVGLNYHHGLFPEMRAAQQTMRERELRQMAEQGMNSVTLPAPASVATVDEFVATARAAGLLRRHRGLLPVWSLANRVIHQHGVAEFGAEFMRRFEPLVAGLSREWPALAYVIDEPRELAPHPWNRNFAATKRFLEIYRAAGWPTMVTLMADRSHGRDYVPLVELMDVVSTHPTTASRGIFAAARRHGTELWLYNAGMDRLSWGFYPWAVGATGRWEWHYQWWGQPYDPFARGSDGPWSPGFGVVMPGPDGPVPTLAYELVRAGIDDYRYLARLEELIRQHPAAGARGRQMLEELRAAIPEFLDGKTRRPSAAQLDDWRRQIALEIVRLQAE